MDEFYLSYKITFYLFANFISDLRTLSTTHHTTTRAYSFVLPLPPEALGSVFCFIQVYVYGPNTRGRTPLHNGTERMRTRSPKIYGTLSVSN